MSTNNQEIESKFYVRDLKAVETKLQALGAVCQVPRGFEYNLRYDDVEHNLQNQHKVLRLRKSDDVRITFKGPGERQDGAIIRTELEIIVNDFETAHALIEALGYHVAVSYEKYRAMYALDQALVTLDELPYGTFVEIEAPDAGIIPTLAKKLGLQFEAAIPLSYLGLFDHVRTVRGLSAQNLSFADFQGVSISADDLGVSPAD